MKYTGEECFGCKSVFTEEDDVVVCPDCGTPYHRSCFKSQGKCLNDELHASKGAWQPTISVIPASSAVKKSSAEERILCDKCGGLNEADAKKCTFCGEPLEDEKFERLTEDDVNFENDGSFFGGIRGFMNAESDAAENILNEEIADNVSMREAVHFVDFNTFYYIPIFQKMKTFGSKISFSFICLLFPYFYFANRRMWLPAIGVGILTALLSIPELLLLIQTQGETMPFMRDVVNYIYDNEKLITSFMDICNLLSWGVKILCFLFANYIYYRHTIRKISKAKASRRGIALSPAQLKAMGGVRPLNILLIALIIFGFSLIMELGVMILLMLAV